MPLEENYNEFLLSKLKQIFSKKELEAYLESNEKQRPTVIRINTLLSRRKDLAYSLSQRKVETGNLEWTDTALVAYKSEVPLGATPEYLAGYYMIQGANSMLPVLNLDLKENMKVVDLCAAPGGKTSHIAALMNNTGILYANDMSKDRIASLRSNISRMGIQNTIITCMDAGKFNVGKVDRVLLDAPCSGTGVISKDPLIKTSKSAEEISRLSKTQKKLILHAFDMLKTGGVMIYSTCSILVEENEEVVDYLLTNRKNAKISDLNIGVGKEGFIRFRSLNFNGSISKSRRIYPHVHNMDGFYYVKITKLE